MLNNYAKAYTEVLEILSHFSEEEFSKIPKEKLDNHEKNNELQILEYKESFFAKFVKLIKRLLS